AACSSVHARSAAPPARPEGTGPPARKVPARTPGEYPPARPESTSPPGKYPQLMNAPGSETGPGPQLVTWGKATILSVDAHGFKFDYTLNSAKHIPFDWEGP